MTGAARFRLDAATFADPAARAAFRERIGPAFVFPELGPVAPGTELLHVRAARVQDVAATTVAVGPELRHAGGRGAVDDVAWLYVVDRGSWTLGEPGGAATTVRPGGFLLHHVLRHRPNRAAPGTRARVLVLPSGLLPALPRERALTGSARAAEVRLLLAHLRAVHETVAGLGTAGVGAARDAAVELTNAVAKGVVDGAEPLLAPALVRAAVDLVDGLLDDPGLSPGLLARRLSVSRRTLQRAFAQEGLSVAASVRDRRLEAVRRALLEEHPPGSRPSVAELAARWQFADGSHLARAFRRRFGVTPVEYRQGAAPERDVRATHASDPGA